MAGTSAVRSPRRRRYAPDGFHRGVPRGRGGLAQRRADLEARWREALERVTTLSVAYHDAAAGRLPGPPGQSAVQAGDAASPPQGDTEASQLARRVTVERLALADIEAALDRIALGRYGRCEQCHRPMSAGLLAAQPETRFCSTCSRLAAPRGAYASPIMHGPAAHDDR
jgi:RNA polymerase-binding transcription factor DksA